MRPLLLLSLSVKYLKFEFCIYLYYLRKIQIVKKKNNLSSYIAIQSAA